MKASNVSILENLSLYCHIGGFLIVFLGIFVAGVNLVNKEFYQIQSGIFIIITGYALVKISQQVSAILKDEQQSPS